MCKGPLGQSSELALVASASMEPDSVRAALTLAQEKIALQEARAHRADLAVQSVKQEIARQVAATTALREELASGLAQQQTRGAGADAAISRLEIQVQHLREKLLAKTDMEDHWLEVPSGGRQQMDLLMQTQSLELSTTQGLVSAPARPTAEPAATSAKAAEAQVQVEAMRADIETGQQKLAVLEANVDELRRSWARDANCRRDEVRQAEKNTETVACIQELLTAQRLSAAEGTADVAARLLEELAAEKRQRAVCLSELQRAGEDRLVAAENDMRREFDERLASGLARAKRESEDAATAVLRESTHALEHHVESLKNQLETLRADIQVQVAVPARESEAPTALERMGLAAMSLECTSLRDLVGLVRDDVRRTAEEIVRERAQRCGEIADIRREISGSMLSTAMTSAVSHTRPPESEATTRDDRDSVATQDSVATDLVSAATAPQNEPVRLLAAELRSELGALAAELRADVTHCLSAARAEFASSQRSPHHDEMAGPFSCWGSPGRFRYQEPRERAPSDATTEDQVSGVLGIEHLPCSLERGQRHVSPEGTRSAKDRLARSHSPSKDSLSSSNTMARQLESAFGTCAAPAARGAASKDTLSISSTIPQDQLLKMVEKLREQNLSLREENRSLKRSRTDCKEVPCHARSQSLPRKAAEIASQHCQMPGMYSQPRVPAPTPRHGPASITKTSSVAQRMSLSPSRLSISSTGTSGIQRVHGQPSHLLVAGHGNRYHCG